jgi:hypothetical protein
MGAQRCPTCDSERCLQLAGLRPEAQRFRITSRNPIPASSRARDPGSGTVISVAVYIPVNDPVVGPVVVVVPVMVDSPVSPANIPVPPVKSVLIVTAVVSPLTVPLPVKVPKKVPPAKTVKRDIRMVVETGNRLEST